MNRGQLNMGIISGWQTFFDGHAPQYEQNIFTRNTLAEVEFLIEELELKEGASLLDVGCGTGRHSIELARRGYHVTGIDLSSGMLAEAKKAAQAAGVVVTWIQSDAAQFSTDKQFAAVICLCEGAFGLLSSEKDALSQPLAILRNVASAMQPGARCLFTVLNGYAMVRRHSNEDVQQGAFDPLTCTEQSDCKPTEDMPTVTLRERGFIPTELTLLFQTAGLDVLHIWGGTAGSWNKQVIDLDEMEIMIVAQKSA
jgi:cyclopropane fatty-acyl-phospholipid synthase-like methyltransferase